MKNYAKVLLYAYPLLKTVGTDYEEHIRNKALLSYDSRLTAEGLAEELAGEIIKMRRLEWLKAKIEEVLAGLSDVERELVALRYFGKSKKKAGTALRNPLKGRSWTERTYFRRQLRLGDKLGSMLLLAGVSEEIYLREFREMDIFAKIHQCVEAGKDKKISAGERRFMGIE